MSAAEQRAYAGRVLADLSIMLDGQRVEPELLAWSFPPPRQMQDGIGEIKLHYRAVLPPADVHRTLSVENRHLRASSVYLMNALVPADARIRILSQTRSAQQSIF